MTEKKYHFWARLAKYITDPEEIMKRLRLKQLEKQGLGSLRTDMQKEK